MNSSTDEIYSMRLRINPEIRELAQRQSALCKIFSNTQRVLILWFLSGGERTVSEIAWAIGASLPSTSQHLRLMELNEILESRREKHNIYYRVDENKLIRNCLVLTDLPKGELIKASLET
jgi:ArsR family transcriptional regulator